jgi:hypothetical protein
VTSLYLKIISTPPGEAPDWVREKWVGLVLPLAQKSPDVHVYRTGGGVLSSPKSHFDWLVAWLSGKLNRESGHVVECVAAVEVLSHASPDAANWWYKNTPHLMKPHKYFLFQEGTGYVQTSGAP